MTPSRSVPMGLYLLLALTVPLSSGCHKKTTLDSGSSAPPAAVSGQPVTPPKAAEDRNKELLIGSWQSTDPNSPGTLEITPDGKVFAVIGDQSAQGSYRFLEADTLELTLPVPGKPPFIQKTKFQVNRDQLVTTDIPSGEVNHFRRASAGGPVAGGTTPGTNPAGISTNASSGLPPASGGVTPPVQPPKLRTTLPGHTDWVRSVVFSPDGKTLASGGYDSSARIWDVATGKELAILRGHTIPVFSVAFSPDRKTLASGSADRTIKLWDVATGKEQATLQGHTAEVWSVAFSPDGKTLASGSRDQTIKLWDVAAGKERATLQGHTDIVFSVAFSPDGKTLAAGSGGIKLWDAATGQERATFPGPKFLSVAFSPDGKTLAAGGSDGTIKVWDMQTAKEQTTLQGPTQSVDAVAFSPDGKTLVSGSEDKTLRLWDLATGKEQTSLQGQLVPVSLAFSPDGKTLAVGRVYEKAIELWDVTPGNAADNPSGVAAVQPPPAPVAPPSHSSLDNTPSPPTSPSPPERKEGPRPVDPRVAPLLRQLNSPQTQDKVAALKGLGDLGPDVREVAGMAVASALLNRFPTVQNAAKDALTRIDPEVAPLCNAILFQTDQDSHVKSLQAIQALGRKGRSATPILIWVVKNRADTTETPTDSEATFAVRALTDVANDQAILPDLYLSWLHNSPDFRVRTGAAGGLPKLDKVKNINQVITALSLAARTDKAQSVRYWAASALGDFGASARAAEGTLQQIMASDPDAQVREVAEKSLRKIQESSRSPNPEIPGASPSGPGASGVPSTTPTPSSGGGNPTSEQEALDQVKALGATIEGGGGRPVFVTVNAKALTDADLGRLEADLKAMPNLKKLVLQGQTVTDAWLPHVKELTKLEELGLIDTAVTDAGVKNLTGLTNLNLLSLYGTPVTDASIPTLSQLKGLKQVFLSRTKVTDPGAAELQKALPEALILHSGG